MASNQQRVRRPDKEDGRRRPVSVSPQIPPGRGSYNRPPPVRLWDDPNLPVEIRNELLTELKVIVDHIARPNGFTQLMSYVTLWHPRLPAQLHSAHSDHRARRGFLLPANDLAEIVWSIGMQPELLRLLSDRGPDYGLSLLLVLELCFQVAFCLRKPGHCGRGAQQEARRNYSAIITSTPKLMEVLSLHLDSPPLRPRFIRKFALVCLGCLYHRKFPSACLTRFFQLHFFVNPGARKHVFEKQPASMDRAHYLPKEAAEAVEQYLWNKAAELSLGGPSDTLKPVGPKGEIVVDTQRAAMAVVFERLNYIARGLFGTSLCLYGSAASGFATCHSDVDVVLQLGRSGVDTMLEDLRRVRAQGGIDINPFPARSQNGFSRPCEDWLWTAERPPSTVATIWAGRKLAWACHRLYGWDVQCVQHAYVPIVRVLAAVDQNGTPHAIPSIFRPAATFEASFPVALERVISPQSAALPCAPDPAEALERLCQSPNGRITAVLALLKCVAHNLICEKLYASWRCDIDTQLTEAAICFYHATRSEQNHNVMKLPETQILLDCLVQYARSTEDPFSKLMCGPGLPSALGCELDDGRLSPPDPIKEDSTLWFVDADCSMDRSVGIHNSRLLRAYASCDPRVVALTLLIKHWARSQGIGDAYSGYLSGYQWTLMVIHYLQHYLCMALPPKYLKDQALLKDLGVDSRRQAGKKHMLPLVPNLQRIPPVDGFLKSPVTVHELEGIADVFFYEPTLGANRPLPRNLQEACRSEPTPDSSPPPSPRRGTRLKLWPEDSLLRTDPLAYAYKLLTCPFEMSPKSVPTANNDELWRCRIASCPRAPRETKNLKQSAVAWDIERAEKKALMLNPQTPLKPGINGRGSVSLATTFPSLENMRDEQFVNDHIVTRKSLQLPFHNAVSLTELLYGFFEYYGMRFNFATDISDIDRVPSLPAAKKEYFETSIFKPQLRGLQQDFPRTARELSIPESRRQSLAPPEGPAEESAGGDASSVETGDERPVDDVTLDGEVVNPSGQSESGQDEVEAEGQQELTVHKEVTGRGKGAFQFRGRHFICIRDPFEKERTIGPPFYCQSHISTEILSALQLFGWARCKEEEESGAAVKLIPSLFNTRMGHSYGHIYHPFKEGLRDTIKSINEESEPGDPMYANLADVICSHGNYNGLLEERNRAGQGLSQGGQTQSQPPPGTRRPSQMSIAPPGFQNETVERLRGFPPRPPQPQQTPNLLPSPQAPPSPQPMGFIVPTPPGLPYNPGGGGSGTGASAGVPHALEDLILSCAHFRPNMGDLSALETFPQDVRRFRSKEFTDPLEWLRGRSDIVCNCSHLPRPSSPNISIPNDASRGGVGSAMEFARYDRIAASCERSIPHPLQAWPPWHPPSAGKKPEEAFLLDLIQGKVEHDQPEYGARADSAASSMAHLQTNDYGKVAGNRPETDHFSVPRGSRGANPIDKPWIQESLSAQAQRQAPRRQRGSGGVQVAEHTRGKRSTGPPGLAMEFDHEWKDGHPHAQFSASARGQRTEEGGRGRGSGGRRRHVNRSVPTAVEAENCGDAENQRSNVKRTDLPNELLKKKDGRPKGRGKGPPTPS